MTQVPHIQVHNHRNLCIHTPKDTHKKSYSSSLHNSSTLETTKYVQKVEFMNKLCYSPIMEYYTAINNECTTSTAAWKAVINITLSERSKKRYRHITKSTRTYKEQVTLASSRKIEERVGTKEGCGFPLGRRNGTQTSHGKFRSLWRC